MWSRQCFWSWGPFCGLISCPNHPSLFLPLLGFFLVFLAALSTWNLTLQWAHASGGLLVHLFAHQSLVLGKFGPTRHHSNQPDHSEHHDLRQDGSKHLQRDVSIIIIMIVIILLIDHHHNHYNDDNHHQASWLDARNICREMCMDLVSMETQEEQKMVRQSSSLPSSS